MPVYRSPDLPHQFCPKIAKRLGLEAAIVQYACREICFNRGGNHFDLQDIIERCDYLSPNQIREALDALIDLGLVEGGEA